MESIVPQKTQKKSKTEDIVSIAAFGNKDKKKPTKISFEVLRALRDVNPLVNVCIETLKHIVVKIPFSIHAKDLESNELYKNEIDYLTNLFNKPNPQETRRIFWLKVLDDILTIDRGATEIIYNSKGYVCETYHVDGATIRPCYDEYGLLCTPAYQQYVKTSVNEPVAEFEENEMKILMNSPIGILGMNGYGKSPVERILLTVITSTNAENFNAGAFDNNKLPPFAISLLGAKAEQVKAFEQSWKERSGGGLWDAVFTNQDFKLEQLRPSNQEMQYYELSMWLARIVIAGFEMSPQDLGLTMDINKSTGEVQQNISKNQAIRNLLSIMTEWHNGVIDDLSELNPRFKEIEFEFDEMDKLDEKTQAEIDKLYIDAGVMIADEIRTRDGRPPLQEIATQYGTTNEQEVTSVEPEQKVEDLSMKIEEYVNPVPSVNSEIDINKSQNDKFEIWYKTIG